jgi:hypothetical protein
LRTGFEQAQEAFNGLPGLFPFAEVFAVAGETICTGVAGEEGSDSRNEAE